MSIYGVKDLETPEDPYASMDSVTLPIWLTFNRRALQAFLSMPVLTRFGLVTNRSSLKYKKAKYIPNPFPNDKFQKLLH